MTDWSTRFEPRTRGGYEFEIFAEREGFLFGAIRNVRGVLQCGDWSLKGEWSADDEESDHDLIPIPAKPKVVKKMVYLYLNAYGCHVVSNLPHCVSGWRLIASKEVEFEIAP